MAHTHAADFLIERQRQMQGTRKRQAGGADHGHHGAGDEALHVGAAPSINAPIAQGCLERRRGPGLPRHGDHIGVAREQDAGHIQRAHGRVQIAAPGVLRVRHQRGRDAGLRQQFPHTLDEFDVRRQRDGLEREQFAQ
ncbi:hypothetical protein G6F32_013894 [Rhizopus arrhizus]|nr:hypothetical protein G6F32_013894 [Rhizopus arrhizus]